MKRREKQGFESQITGGRGISRIKELFLSWGWLPRESKEHDQGIDLMVEVGNSGKGLGIHFAVQVKASASSSRTTTKGRVIDLKRSNVEYFERQRVAVFLLFVDLESSDILWLDVLQALKSCKRRANGIA